eukprot:539998-Pleurochrysis_carterae.AAC.3
MLLRSRPTLAVLANCVFRGCRARRTQLQPKISSLVSAVLRSTSPLTPERRVKAFGLPTSEHASKQAASHASEFLGGRCSLFWEPGRPGS